MSLLTRLSNPVSVLAGVFIVGALFATVYTSSVGDGDLYWQLVYGRHLLDTGQLIPDHSAFTWSKASNQIIYCAWLPEIGFELLYGMGGLSAFYLLRYAVLLGIVVGLWTVAKRWQIPAPVATYSLCLVLVGAAAGANLKPELFSVFFFALCTITLYEFKAQPQHKWSRLGLALTPIYLCLWANCHGGFVFAAVLYGGFLLGEALNVLFKRPQRLPPGTGKFVGFSMLGTLLAPCFTPYGCRYPVQLVQDRLMSQDNQAMMNYVAAWIPTLDPRIAGMMNRESLVGLALLCGIGFWRGKHWDFTVGIHNLAFASIFLLYARAAFLWPLVAVVSVFYLLRGVRWEGAHYPWMGLAALSLSVLIALRMAYYAVFLTVPHKHWGIGPGHSSPVIAAELLKELPSRIRLANTYDSGGYLMWALHPQRQVMIDPRGFPFREWFSEYSGFAHGEKALEFLTKTQCKVVFAGINRKKLVKTLMASPEWKAVLLEPAGTTFLHRTVSEPADLASFQERAYRELKNVRTNDLIVPNAIRLRRLDWAKGFVERAEELAGRGERTRTQRTLYEAVRAVYEERYDEAIKLYEELLSRNELGSYTTLERLYGLKIKTSPPDQAKIYQQKLEALKARN